MVRHDDKITKIMLVRITMKKTATHLFPVLGLSQQARSMSGLHPSFHPERELTLELQLRPRTPWSRMLLHPLILLCFPTLNDFHGHRIRQPKRDEVDHTRLREVR